MKKNRIGICLAVALLSFIFYLHMENKSLVDGKCKRGMKVIIPVSEWFRNHIENGGVITGERFGICGVSKHTDRKLLEANCDSENGLPNHIINVTKRACHSK